VKDLFLYLSKWCGLFAVSRFITRNGVRILCYHGFAFDDETQFRPALFMSPETFRRRLEALETLRYPVISLEAALAGLDKGQLPRCATVLTIDDGFYGVYAHAVEALRAHNFPATLYVVTYNCVKQTPIFRLVVQYQFWKTSRPTLDLADLGSPLTGRFSLDSSTARDEAALEIIAFAEACGSEAERVRIATRLGELLGVDYKRISLARILSLMTPEEVRRVADQGIDVQLHTHRHRLPQSEELAMKEIGDNRAVLESLLGKRLDHLCYPSGVWSADLSPCLTRTGIKSATTCDIGLNYPLTPHLQLKRILDGEDLSQISFEAEMAGYKDVLRWSRAFARRLFGRKAQPVVRPVGPQYLP
jgi:peptidoglycan/xylan/chitin deacetylase (PgdA/CDA1 family)